MSTETLEIKDIVLVVQQKYRSVDGVVAVTVSHYPGSNGSKDRLDVTVKMDEIAINDSIKRDLIWSTGRLLRKDYPTLNLDLSVQVERTQQ